MNPNYMNFIWNEERNFVFAYVPKVACTNWKSVLRYLAGHADYLDNKLAHDRKASGLHFLDLNGPGRRVVEDPAIPKYTFIRDPFTRILSAYLDKIDRRLPRLDEPRDGDHFLDITRDIERFRLGQLDPRRHPQISFEVFLKWLKRSPSAYLRDEHWQSQTTLLRWPEIAFDLMGRFKSIGPDSHHLLDLMGCDIPFPSQREVRFPPTSAETRMNEFYTDQARSLVAEIYRSDFDNFGYSV